MSFESWVLFAVTVFLASIVPGPSMLLALTHGMKYGPRRTVATASGNVVATFLQAAVSMAGIGAALAMCRPAFLAVKWCGILYLLYMGISLWRTPFEFAAAGDNEKSPTPPTKSGKNGLKMFAQAFTVTMANPKAIVFFTALFPQFVDFGTSGPAGFTVVIATLLSIAFGCFMLYACFGGVLLEFFRSRGVTRYFNRVVGGSFIAAAAGLAMDRD